MIFLSALLNWRTDIALAETHPETWLQIGLSSASSCSFTVRYFVGAADGPSGWHVPTLPLRPKKQEHGYLQMSPLVHGLPHATTACVPVLSWWRDNAPAERAAVSIAANTSFFAMC
jgi:hypothetical protein